MNVSKLAYSTTLLIGQIARAIINQTCRDADAGSGLEFGYKQTRTAAQIGKGVRLIYLCPSAVGQCLWPVDHLTRLYEVRMKDMQIGHIGASSDQ